MLETLSLTPVVPSDEQVVDVSELTAIEVGI